MGTWTAAPPSPTNNGPAFGLWLLTDGTVLSHGNALNHWVKLTPDANGDYSKGTWSTLASSAYARGGAQEHVLKDGRFFEAGGEFLYVYPGCASACAQPPNGSALFKNVEIYDPVANTWTIEASGMFDIGDTGSATLGDGRILESTRVSSQNEIYDPATNTWSVAASLPAGVGTGDENAWASLQNGGVLAVAPQAAAVYNPATNTWVRTGAPPAALTTTLSTGQVVQFGDVAGISQMFDGRVIAYGFGKTAIYTPGATASDPGTWAMGPAMLNGNEAEDEYTVTEPNGKVMIATYPFQGSPNTLQEFDPTTNTMAAITPPPDRVGPYPVSYLNLPSGQVMVTSGGQDWLYTPDSAPNDAWRPTVTSVVSNGNNTYTLTGTQISGLINGGDEGDDMTMAENYPIVWLKDSTGKVFFCRSFNFSNMMPSKGNTPETCQFTTPANLPAGSYSLFLSAVGVQSKTAFPFTTGVGGTGSSTSSSSTSTTSSTGGGTTTTTSSGTGTATSGGSTSHSTSSGSNASSGSTGSNGSSASNGSTAGSTGGNTGGATSGGPGSSGGSTSGSTTGSSSSEGGTGNSAGCGCVVAGSASQRGGLGALLGFASAIGLWGRRRRTRGDAER